MSLVGPGRHYAPAFSRAMATLYGESELRASIRDPPGKPRSPLGEVAMLSHVAPKPVWLSLSAGFCCCIKRSWQPSPVSLGVRTSLEVRGVHSRVLVKAGHCPLQRQPRGLRRSLLFHGLSPAQRCPSWDWNHPDTSHHPTVSATSPPALRGPPSFARGHLAGSAPGI